MKTFKKIIATLLVVVMCLTSAPLQGFVGMEWPSLPEINFGDFELPKLDFGSWFSSKASALSKNGQCGGSVNWDYDYKTQTLTIGGVGEMWNYGSEGSPFYNSSIEAIIIKDGVTSIGGYAFENCESLKVITIANSVQKIGDRAFSECKKLEDITIPENVETIGDYAFYGCYLITNIIIPENVETIGDYAFYGCYLITDIIIPDSVLHIGFLAFNETYFYNNTSNWDGDVLYIGKHLIFANNSLSGNYKIREDTLSIANGAFSNCTKLISVIIPEGVKAINQEAFANCVDLVSVLVPKSVSTIGKGAFYGCSNLTSVTLSNNVTDINDYVFYNCVNMENIIIPNSVKNIGAYAFYNCDGLINIAISNKVKTIGAYAFYDCDNIESIVFSDEVLSIGAYAFYDCDNIESIVLPDKVLSIGVFAFGNTALYKNTSNWENGVLYIGKHLIDSRYGWLLPDYIIKEGTLTLADGAFKNTSIKSVVIPDSVVIIGAEAFYQCTELTKVDMGNSVKIIGNRAFYFCGIIDITLSDNVTDIGNNAFTWCSELKNIYIPDSVTSIGTNIFDNCKNLTAIYYGGTLEQWTELTNNLGGDKLHCNSTPGAVSGNNGTITGTITDWDSLDNIVHIDNVAYSVKNDSRLEVDVFNCKYRKVRCKLENGIIVSCDPISEGTEIVFGNGYKYHIYTGETSLHYKEDGENGFSITGLDAKLFSDTLTGEDVTWSCSDESKLKIVKYSGILYNNEKGYYYLKISVKALKPGTVTLTATAKDGTSASCEVMVKGTDSYLSVYSDTSTSASVDEELCLYVASFKNGKQTWQERDLNIVFDNPEIFEVSSTGFYSEYGKEEVYFKLYLEAKKVGTTTLTISDPETKAFIDVPLTATEKMNVMRFDDVPSKEYQKGRQTNFYNYNGLCIDGFTYRKEGDYYKVGMNAYNAKNHYGVVVAYDKNGKISDFDILEPHVEYKTTVTETIADTWFSIRDVYKLFGDDYYYTGESISQYTRVDLKVPEDGYLIITNNCVENEIAYVVNIIEYSINTALSIASASIGIAEKGELVKDLSETIVRDLIELGLSQTVQSYAASLSKNFSYKNINKNVADFSDAMKKLDLNIVKIVTDAINVKFGISVVESVIWNVLPTGKIVELMNGFNDVCNAILHADDFAKSKDAPQIVLYPPLDKGESYSSKGIVVNPEKDLPDGCVLHTYVISDEHKIASEIKPVLDTKASKYKIHNITLYKNGKEIQPNGKIKVMVPIPEGYNHNNIKIYWYKDDGTLVEIKAKVEGGYAVFETDHLSNYVICDSLSQGVITESGICGAYGDNVKWELDRDGVLRIYGTGMMNEFILKDSPWYNDSNSFDIQSVIVEQGVTTIGPGAFKNLKNLKNVYISNTVVDIGIDAFSRCSYQLKEIFIPANVKTIGVYAFDGCTALSSVVIEDGVETIDDCAFRYCDIEYINIPKSVVYIGDDAFAGNYSLKGIFVDSRNANYVSDIYGVLFDKNITTLMIYPLQSTLTSYIIPNTVISIERLAFFWANNLKNVTVSNSVKEIKESAFARMENLKEVTLYNSVENIGSNVFNGCENLSDIYFYGTSNEWKNITISKDNEELHNANIHYMTHTHVYKQDKILPTCTEQGKIKYSCSCGYSYTESIPTTSHSYKEGDSRCTICGYDKTNDCNCNCHKGGIKSFFFKLILFFQKIFKTNKVCKCGKYHY